MKKVSEMDHEKRNVDKHVCFCGKEMIFDVCPTCEGHGRLSHRDYTGRYAYCPDCGQTGKLWRCPDGHTEEIKRSSVTFTIRGRLIEAKWLDNNPPMIAISLKDTVLPPGYNCVWVRPNVTDMYAETKLGLEGLLSDEKALKMERESRREGDAVLCYINTYENIAYFTTQSLQEQRGEGWHTDNYEHNSNPPDEWYGRFDQDKPKWEIYAVRFETQAMTPAQINNAMGYLNCRCSVNEINKEKKFPWLVGYGVPAIYAGTTLRDFKRIIKSSGGTIFVPEED